MIFDSPLDEETRKARYAYQQVHLYQKASLS